MSDLISRQKVLNTLDFADNALTDEERTVEKYKELLTECVKVLPPAKNDGDLISRQAAIDRINKQREHLQPDIYPQDKIGDATYRICAEFIARLPSAQPERKTGHWIKTARWGRVYYCDQCRNYLDFDGVNVGRGSTNYCPNCGADMREVNDERPD